jgi:hypothetical protein
MLDIARALIETGQGLTASRFRRNRAKVQETEFPAGVLEGRRPST